MQEGRLVSRLKLRPTRPKAFFPRAAKPRTAKHSREQGAGRRRGTTTMLMPKKVKYRKQQRGRRTGKAWRGGSLAFGEYGLKALEPAWITDRQIEAARVAITRFIKRGGKLWIRVFPDKPFTKKPAETRMGKGKGPPEHWVAVVKPGRVMFEMAGVDLASATEAMELAAHKLPIKTQFVTREGGL